MSIINKLQWRYATKKFDSSKELSHKQIEILKNAFSLTAVSYGLQTVKLVVVKNKEKRKPLMELSYGQSQVVDASHLLVLCIQTEINEDDINAHFENIVKIRQTPKEILAPFKEQMLGTIEKMTNEQKVDWASKQAYIALGNLMTVCANEGIDACPMEGFIPGEYDKILGLNKIGLKSVVLLPVGFRAKDDMFATLKKVRKPISETIIEL
jgi:nitroreductase